VAHQRTASPDSERGYDAIGSEVHKGGRKPHVAVDDGKAPVRYTDLEAFTEF